MSNLLLKCETVTVILIIINKIAVVKYELAKQM